LIVQEESQREIFLGSLTHDTAALMTTAVPMQQNRLVKPHNQKEKSICSHCNIPGHTVDKCYRLHGYPPGFKFTKKPPHSGFNKPSACSVGHFQEENSNNYASQPQPQMQLPQVPFTAEQCHQLLALIKPQANSHHASANQVGILPTPTNSDHLFSNMTGNFSFHSILHPKHSVFHSRFKISNFPHNPKDSPWIIDTGATDHMVNSTSFFTTITTIVSTSVTLPNGDLVQVTHIGTIKISDCLVLTNVLCVPSFSFNLISASKLIKYLTCCLIFIANHCFIQNLVNWKTIGVGEERGGLFYLLQTPKVFAATSRVLTASLKDPSSDLWHYRLGHLSHSRLSLLHSLVPSVSVDSNKVCNVCPLAKQHRLPFPVSTTISQCAFDLVHVDIWGPFSIQSINGSRFFLTIVDDFSRYTWTYLMHSKSQTRCIIQSFFTMVATQFNLKIKTLRSDNGVEFHMDDFFSQHGTLHQLSCVETPQQNSVVERKHQHLLNVARALRFQAHLPLFFWGDCVLTATHLINRIPSPLLSNKSPFELLYSTPPTYSHLRVFGCLAFVFTLTRDRSKFDPRSIPSIFIGYPNGTKGYKLFNLTTKSVYISRHVVFHENIFPYASNLLHTNSQGVFLPSPYFSDHSNDTSPSIPSFITHCDDTPDSPNFSISSNPPSISPVSSHTSPILPTSSSSSPVSSIPQHVSLPLRHSTRSRHAPRYLQQYHCQLASHPSSFQSSSLAKTANDTGIPHCLSSVISYDHFSSSHKIFSLSVTSHYEPKFFHQAIKFPHWREAMNTEISALQQNNTWVLTPLPQGKKAIGCKWVYKVKLKANGSVERYKARLVAKGYTQSEGLDYHETFSPIAKLTTVRCLLAIAAAKNWSLTQLDVNNAFLHGDLDEEVYMTPPPGFDTKRESHVCKLVKSLYGLKQASRQWFSKFSSTLLAHGFTQSKSDYSLFTQIQGSSFIALLVYVDDIILASNDPTAISALTVFLNQQFHLKDLGPLKYFLGLEVARSDKGLSICQ